MVALCAGLILADAQRTPVFAFDFFEALFGRPLGPEVRAYAPQAPAMGDQPAPAPRSSAGGGMAYCVRLCDGRFFPVSRRRDASTVELCSSFCPAAKTKVFSGSLIDHAVARDGERYSDLPTAFAFRDRLVPDCTCNGKTAGGLAPVSIQDDPTLRQGDVVATQSGFRTVVAPQSGGERLSEAPADLRGRLGALKVAPVLPESAGTQDPDLGGLRTSAQRN